MSVQWGLGQGNNALAMFQQGAQLGGQIRERREQSEYRNALLEQKKADGERQQAEFAAQQQDREAKQKDRLRSEMGLRAKLLAKAQKSPQDWANAYAAGEQLGLDMSGVPKEYTPDWAAQNQLIAEAMAKDGGERLSGVSREIEEATGFAPGSPEHRQALQQALTGKYGVDYADEQGNMRRRSIFGSEMGSPQTPPIAGGDDDEWEVVGGGGTLGDPAGLLDRPTDYGGRPLPPGSMGHRPSVGGGGVGNGTGPFRR